MIRPVYQTHSTNNSSFNQSCVIFSFRPAVVELVAFRFSFAPTCQTKNEYIQSVDFFGIPLNQLVKNVPEAFEIQLNILIDDELTRISSNQNWFAPN